MPRGQRQGPTGPEAGERAKVELAMTGRAEPEGAGRWEDSADCSELVPWVVQVVVLPGGLAELVLLLATVALSISGETTARERLRVEKARAVPTVEQAATAAAGAAAATETRLGKATGRRYWAPR